MSRICACLFAGCCVGVVAGIGAFFIATELLDGRTEVSF